MLLTSTKNLLGMNQWPRNANLQTVMSRINCLRLVSKMARSLPGEEKPILQSLIDISMTSRSLSRRKLAQEQTIRLAQKNEMVQLSIFYIFSQLLGSESN